MYTQRDPSIRRLCEHGIFSDSAKTRTRNLFRPKSAPIPLGHIDRFLYFSAGGRLYGTTFLLTSSSFFWNTPPILENTQPRKYRDASSDINLASRDTTLIMILYACLNYFSN